ncbi:hypothetical protein NC653_004308 [Populus alba x Populus x berolinensis]|uniref:Uncharacterized protein n=1 Tax=Populus alba x Populus x berolinensis TaxID=444605 RepID=A0AAD6RTR5_9ROSI|nr:hypothetical protein NC653_004308 [Populus alba x Populus x berolinensis]
MENLGFCFIQENRPKVHSRINFLFLSE